MLSKTIELLFIVQIYSPPNCQKVSFEKTIVCIIWQIISFQLLDLYFGSVCELDIIYNYEKVTLSNPSTIRQSDLERVKFQASETSFRYWCFESLLQAYFILDEFLLAGEIQETSKKCVLNAIKLQVIKKIRIRRGCLAIQSWSL